jgi:Skp family chaperone for outer membrane proteins
MKTRRLAVSLLAGGLAVTVIGWGCNKQNTANGGAAQSSASNQADAASAVGIVDYQKVLRDMGWATKLDAELGTYRDQLSKEFTAFDQHYAQQLTELQKSMNKDAEKLTPQQQQQLTQTVVAARQTLGQLQTQANEKWQAYRTEQLRRYKDALAPIVRQAAQKGNYKLVLAQTDVIVFMEPTIDLSNVVVDLAKSQKPDITEVPMTSLQGPDKISPNMAAPTTGPATQPATMPSTTRP